MAGEGRKGSCTSNRKSLGWNGILVQLYGKLRMTA